MAAFAVGEGLDPTAIPEPDEVDEAWCLRFLRAIRDVSFATVDADGLPSVRVIDVMAVTEDSLYFLAPRGKQFHSDVVRTGYVAIVGQTHDYRTCRLRGRVEHPEGEGEYFDLGQKPILRVPFWLGAARTLAGTFLITGACTGCGRCAASCPEACISPGEPFTIDQAHCLRCGICQEACPAQAVVKR